MADNPPANRHRGMYNHTSQAVHDRLTIERAMSCNSTEAVHRALRCLAQILVLDDEGEKPYLINGTTGEKTRILFL